MQKAIEEDLQERFKALRTQESAYKTFDYLSKIIRDPNEKQIKTVFKTSRFRMCVWCFDIAKYFKFDPEIVNLAISYVDRFLTSNQRSICELHDAQLFQLVVMCSLNIALKINQSKTIDAYYFIQLSNGRFTRKQIYSMEKEILFALSWRLCPPTCYDFVHFILINLIPPSVSSDVKKSITIMARKQICICTPMYIFSTFDPSIIAMASIFNAIEGLKSISEDIYVKFNRNLKKITGFDHSLQKNNTFKSVKIALKNLIDDHSSNNEYHEAMNRSMDADFSCIGIKSEESPIGVNTCLVRSTYDSIR